MTLMIDVVAAYAFHVLRLQMGSRLAVLPRNSRLRSARSNVRSAAEATPSVSDGLVHHRMAALWGGAF